MAGSQHHDGEHDQADLDDSPQHNDNGANPLCRCHGPVIAFRERCGCGRTVRTPSGTPPAIRPDRL
jgi:hypothetical protein